VNESSPTQIQQKQLCQALDCDDSDIYLTTTSVIDYVEQHFNITYSNNDRRNSVYKKPKRIPPNADDDEPKIFAKRSCETKAIMKSAKKLRPLAKFKLDEIAEGERSYHSSYASISL